MFENIEIYKKRIRLLALATAAPIFGIAPWLVGYLLSLVIPGCTNEANCALAALPWFTFITAPVAIIGYLITLILFLISLTNRLVKTESPTDAELLLKTYQKAWLVTALSPLAIVLAILSPAIAIWILLAMPASWLFLIAVAIRFKLRK